MGLFGTLGGILGTAIAPGVGTAIGAGLGGLVDQRDASSGQRRNSQQQRLDAARGYVPGGPGDPGQGGGAGGLSGNFLMQSALNAAPTQADFNSSFAQQGVGRQAATRLGRLAATQARLQAGTQGLNQQRLFRAGLAGQQMGIDANKQAATTDFRRSFLSSVFDVGAGALGNYLGGQGAQSPGVTTPTTVSTDRVNIAGTSAGAMLGGIRDRNNKGGLYGSFPG